MKLSNVFYKAACGVSQADDSFDSSWFSCNAVDVASVGRREMYSPDRDSYNKLMAVDEGYDLEIYDVQEAAAEVEWSPQAFRTFMLLMAAEAVK